MRFNSGFKGLMTNCTTPIKLWL